MLARDDNGEVISKNGVDKKCSCYLPHKFLDSNIGFEYWTIDETNFEGDSEDLDKIVPYLSQIEKLKNQGRGFYISGPTFGSGKALESSTDILTVEGWKQIKDIKIGDFVYSQNGFPTKVIGVFPQGLKEAYKVSFNDDTSAICCDEHLWKIKKWNKYEKILPLSEIRKDYLNNVGRGIYEIPLVEPIQFSKKDLPLDPYLLGSILEDKENSVIFDEEKKRHQSIACKNEVMLAIDFLGLTNKLSHQKFIPESYLYSCIEDRIALLRGLLDTNGSIAKNNSVEFSTASLDLAKGVKFLTESLGGLCKWTPRNTSYNYKLERKQDKLSYRVRVKMPSNINPFLLTRKAEKFKAWKKYPPNRKIEKIESCGKREMICIAVDDPSKLFVINNFIVTHNTTLGIIFLKKVLQTTKYSALFIPCSELVILNAKYMQNHFDKSLDEKINYIKNVDFLMIDDLGKEFDNSKDWGRAAMNSILRFRAAWQKITIFTSNVEIKELADIYGGSNQSIINGYSIIIPVKNREDFRKTKKIKSLAQEKK